MHITRINRLIAQILILIMMLSLVPFTAFAVEDDTGTTEFKYIPVRSGDHIRNLASLLAESSQTDMAEVTEAEAAALGLEQGTYLICSLDRENTGFNVFYYSTDYSQWLYQPFYTDDLASMIDESIYPDVRFIYKDAHPTWVKVFHSQTDLVSTYETLAEAVTAANSGSDTIRLDSDVTENNLHISSGVIIDLNGHSVDGTQESTGDKNYILYISAPTLITDNSSDGGGAIINGPARGIVVAGCTLTLKNVTVIGCSYSGNGAGVCLESNSSLKLTGPVKIYGNTGADNTPSNLYIVGNAGVTVEGNLFGSDINYSTHSSDGKEIARTLTSGYFGSNPGAGLNNYFHYEGSDCFQTWDSSGKEIEVKQKYIVSLTSDCSGSPVAALIGGGRFALGETATVVASNVANYRFIAWKEGSTEKSRNAIYSFEVTGDVSLTAYYESISNIPFLLTVDSGYAGNITVAGNVSGTDNVYEAAVNGPVKVTANYSESENETFLYWADEKGNKLSGTQVYTFMLVRDMFVRPVVFNEEPGTGEVSVKFLNNSNSLISADTVIIDAGIITKTASVPVPPSRLGYTFSGWNIGGQSFKTQSEALAQIENLAKSGTGLPITANVEYNNPETYNVTVLYQAADGNTLKSQEQFIYNVGDARIFTADAAIADVPFYCWKLSDGNVIKTLSDSRVCTIRPGGDITIIAVYDNPENPLKNDPSAVVTEFKEFTEGEYNKIRITMSYVVPEGAGNVVSCGIIYNKDNSDNMTLDGSARVYTSSLTTQTGNVTLNFVTNKPGTYYAVGFVTVEKDGVQNTFYSSETSSYYKAS